MGRRAEKDKVYEAVETFVSDTDEGPLVVSKGDKVRGGHPLLKGRKDLFKESQDTVKFDVEQTTAAPGEKRG